MKPCTKSKSDVNFKIFYCYFFFNSVYFYFFYFNFIFCKNLAKWIYLLHAVSNFLYGYLCIQFFSGEELKLLIKIIPSSEISISQMCSYISVTFIYKLSVHNLFYLFLHWFISIWFVLEWSCLAIQKLTQTLVIGKDESWGWQYLVLWDTKYIYLVK